MSRKPEITPPPNTSDLLSRLNSFLPQLRDANASLKQRINEQGQGTVDIETLSSSNSEDDDSSDTETDVGNNGKKRQVIEMVTQPPMPTETAQRGLILSDIVHRT